MNIFKQNYTGNFLIGMFFDIGHNPAIMTYAWILPTDSTKMLQKWHKTDGKGDYKNCIQLFGSFSGEAINELFDHLMQGLSLNNACKQANISIFEEHFKYEKIANWVLPHQSYILRPPIIYQELPEYYPQEKSNYYSPAKASIANVETLFCMDKIFFLSLDNIKLNCEFLEKKTGINFTKNQFTRIGNIEWFKFPCTDINDSLAITFDAKQAPVIDNPEEVCCREVVVTFAEHLSGDFLLNIECRNANAVISNEIKQVTTKQTKHVSFFTNEEITSVQIRVWKKTTTNKWEFFHQHSTSYIRSISFSMRPVSNFATIETKKTFDLKKNAPPILQEKIISQERVAFSGQFSNSIIEGRNQDPWRNVICDTNELIETDRRFLNKSNNALFLPQGWNGSVAFIDWYKQLSEKFREIGKIILVDPYADEEALLFLSRIGISGVKFDILANSVVRTDPEAFKRNLLNSLSNIIQKLHMVAVDYYDIFDNKKLHDRYLILQDRQGKLLSGFHLSNSIQGANNNFPLLITEIPLDVLYEISDWLSSQLEDKNLVTLLFSSSEVRNVRKPALLEIDKTKYFFDVLSIKNKVDNKWREICEAAYNNNETKRNIELAAKDFTPQQWDSLTTLVKKLSEEAITPENYRTEFSLYHIFNPNLSLQDTFRNAMRHLTHGHFTSFEVPATISIFVTIALKNAPSKFVELLDKITLNYSSDNLSGTVISATINNLFWKDLDSAELLKTKNQFIQAFICGQIFQEVINEKLSFDDAFEQLNVLSLNQKIVMLSNWVCELRVLQNRNRATDETEAVLSQIFAKLFSLWPLESSNETLEIVFVECSGPTIGCHAASTMNELLIPLINANRLEPKLLWLYLFKIFKEKLSDKHAYINSDVPIYSSIGWLAQIIEESFVTDLTQYFEKLIKKQVLILNQPFIKSIDYESYLNSVTILHHALLAAKCMKSNAANVVSFEYLISTIEDCLKDKNVYLDIPNNAVAKYIEEFVYVKHHD